jgi:hypothetical protein
MATIASPLRPRIRFAAASSGIDVGVTPRGRRQLHRLLKRLLNVPTKESQ